MSTDTDFWNPAPPMAEGNAEALKLLTRSLRMEEGFALYFVLCNSGNLRREAIEQVREEMERLRPGYWIMELPLSTEVDHLHHSLLATVRPPLPNAFLVYGLENGIAQGKGRESFLLLNLNATRNSFIKDYPCAFVFWIPGYLYPEMLAAAPDFCSVNSGIYNLVEAEKPDQAVLEQITSGDYTGILGLSIKEREEHLQRLTRLLEEYHALPEKERDLLAEARILSQIGTIHRGEGDFVAAERCYKEMLEILKQSLPPMHPYTATALNNLASSHTDQGRYGEAELLHKEALEIRKHSLPEWHPDIAMSLDNLGQTYVTRGFYSKAESCHLEALEIRLQTLPKEHSDIANSLNNLACVYSDQYRFSKAIPLMIGALEIYKKALPIGHPYIAASLSNTATLYMKQGRYAEAEPLFIEAVQIAEKSLVPNHPDTQLYRRNLANLHQAMQLPKGNP